jgi:hypothetical protein
MRREKEDRKKDKKILKTVKRRRGRGRVREDEMR